MIEIRSNVVGGFPFVVKTDSNLSPQIIEKFQLAVNIASRKLKRENLEKFVNEFSYVKETYIYANTFWFFKKLVEVKKEIINDFYIDTRTDIFNCSKKEIIDIIQNGNELVLGEGSDGEADIFWRLKNSNGFGVVGYTYSNTIWQWTYRNWVDNMTANELAGHLVHEWLHKIGGEHSSSNHSLRNYTPTYAVGYYVAE